MKNTRDTNVALSALISLPHNIKRIKAINEMLTLWSSMLLAMTITPFRAAMFYTCVHLIDLVSSHSLFLGSKKMDEIVMSLQDNHMSIDKAKQLLRSELSSSRSRLSEMKGESEDILSNSQLFQLLERSCELIKSLNSMLPMIHFV